MARSRRFNLRAVAVARNPSAIVPYSPRAGYRFTVESSVYLRHDVRGRGLGKQLLGELIASAERRKLHSIIAKAAATEEASLELHRHFGFVDAGRLREAGFKRGKSIDVLFLQRML